MVRLLRRYRRPPSISHPLPTSVAEHMRNGAGGAAKRSGARQQQQQQQRSSDAIIAAIAAVTAAILVEALAATATPPAAAICHPPHGMTLRLEFMERAVEVRFLLRCAQSHRGV